MATDPPSVARNIKPQQMAILMPSDVPAASDSSIGSPV
jgi:hypothetical protein